MQEGTKKTVIWETNSEPPRNYIWIKSDGYAYEYDWDLRKWVLSKHIGAPSGVSITTKTTAEWNANGDYVPANGEIVVYSDRRQIVQDGKTINIPAIKIGNGVDSIRDLSFVESGSGSIDLFEEHIHDTTIHTNEDEKNFWNNKVSIDYSELNSEMLIFKTN